MEERSHLEKCPVHVSLSIIGGKWKPVILWYLKNGPLRFGELHKSIPGITQMMLTKQLRELEKDEVVIRTVYPEIPPRVDYRLTDLGISSFPVLESLSTWGKEYLDKRYGKESPSCKLSPVHR